MKIDEMIKALFVMKEKIGGQEEIPIVTLFGENDYIVPSYPIIGNFEDQDGNEFKCAFIGSSGGEEFTEKGTPHYEWKPSKNKLDVSDFTGFSNNSKRFDGYVRIAEEDLKKFPEPTIIDMSDKILKITMSNMFLEDAEVNGYEENPESPKIPGYDSKDESVSWNIDIETGNILNWKPNTTAKIQYKVVDGFKYSYEGFDYKGYVPDFMAIDDDGFGDYVYLTIDKNGNIKNWSNDKFLEEHEKLKKKNNDKFDLNDSK